MDHQLQHVPFPESGRVCPVRAIGCDSPLQQWLEIQDSCGDTRPRNRLFYAEVVHEGYKPSYITSGTHVNTTGVLDIIGACFFIIPIIGVAFPGFMSLDSTYFNVDMDPAPDGL